MIVNNSLDEVFLTGTHIGNGGNIDIWNNGVGSGAALKSLGYTGVLDGDTDITIGEIGGTGNEIISVGAYCSKNSWTAFNGMPGLSNEVMDDVASFSSIGPTVDGRVKPDISAPGTFIASSVNSFDPDYYLTHPNVVAALNQPSTNSEWFYAVMQGTSMASPMVTGIIALLLEVNPNLTPNQIKSILNNNAIVDAYTGSVPNNTWGYGKINAYTSILDVLITPSWDCNGQGNCYDPGTGNGQYSSFSQCQSNCVATSWDCNSQGNCYDPGTGNGQYSSFSQCQSNCVATSWDCNSQGNCYDPGTGNGQYSSFSQCQSNCVATSWDCDGQGNCYDPGTGNGQYSSFSQCQSNCVATSWDCDGQGNCYDPGTGNGQYSSFSQCQSNCVATSWDCDGQGNCYDPGTGNGQYSSFSQCQSNCINVSIEEIGLTEFNIFPNPSNDLFNISFVSNRKQDLRVRVLNVVGEETVKEELQQYIGEYTKQINLEDNAKGIYFLEIETNDGIINKKLILQ
jgi:hypothetical protein